MSAAVTMPPKPDPEPSPAPRPTGPRPAATVGEEAENARLLQSLADLGYMGEPCLVLARGCCRNDVSLEDAAKLTGLPEAALVEMVLDGALPYRVDVDEDDRRSARVSLPKGLLDQLVTKDGDLERVGGMLAHLQGFFVQEARVALRRAETAEAQVRDTTALGEQIALLEDTLVEARATARWWRMVALVGPALGAACVALGTLLG